MAQMQQLFDATTVAPQESMAPIPAGVYLAQVVESDERALKSGAGRCIALTFEVLQGPYARRKVWTQLNYKHTSADAERIGQAQLSALCHAAGVPRLQDTSQLHMRPINIRVKIRKDDSGQYGDKNEVNGFEAAGPGVGAPPMGMPGPAPAPTFPAAAPSAAPAAFAAPAAAAPAAANVPPWARRA